MLEISREGDRDLSIVGAFDAIYDITCLAFTRSIPTHATMFPLLRSTGAIHAEHCPSIEFEGDATAVGNIVTEGECRVAYVRYNVLINTGLCAPLNDGRGANNSSTMDNICHNPLHRGNGNIRQEHKQASKQPILTHSNSIEYSVDTRNNNKQPGHDANGTRVRMFPSTPRN